MHAPISHRTRIMGIVNATPDSFSNEKTGDYCPSQAIEAVYAQASAGADIVDIGAESTRPGAQALTHAEEWQRLFPVLSALKKDMQSGHLTISVDSYHPETVRKAAALGVQMINDVTGLQNPAMCKALAATDCHIISMHALGIPADKQHTLPEGTDIPNLLQGWLKKQKEQIEKYDLSKHSIWFDAGIGFGKTAVQSLELINAMLARNHQAESWLIGHSRKSFLNLIEQHPAPQRDGLTRALSAPLMLTGVRCLRVHDVAGHVALRGALQSHAQPHKQPGERSS